MLNTLEAAFSHCRYFALASGYFNVLCADVPLKTISLSQVQERLQSAPLKPLLQRIGIQLNYLDFFQALEIRFTPETYPRSTAQINRLDLPAIEFINFHASQSASAQASLDTLFNKTIALQKFSSSNKWQTNCIILEKMISRDIQSC